MPGMSEHVVVVLVSADDDVVVMFFRNVTTRRSAPALRRLEGRGCWYRQSRLLRRVG